jgi:hypothetical protein
MSQPAPWRDVEVPGAGTVIDTTEGRIVRRVMDTARRNLEGVIGEVLTGEVEEDRFALDVGVPRSDEPLDGFWRGRSDRKGDNTTALATPSTDGE